MNTEFMIFQCGYGAITLADELWIAVEHANVTLDEKIDYDEIDCYDNVKSPVDGEIYWTCNPEVVAKYTK